MLSSIVLGLVVVTFAWYVYKWTVIGRRNLPPGPRGYPIIGSILEVHLTSPHLTFEKWAKQYGDIVFCKLGGTGLVLLNSPYLVRKAFASSEFGKIFNDRPQFFYGEYVCRNCSGIAFGKYSDRLLELRKVMHQALEMYGEGKIHFEEIVQTELCCLSDIICSKYGGDFNPAAHIEDSLANIISMLLCGKRMPPEDVQLMWNLIHASNNLMLPTLEFLLRNFPVLRLFPFGPGRRFRNVITARDDFINRYFRSLKDTYDPEINRCLVDAYIKLYEKEKSWMTEANLELLVFDTLVAGLISTSWVLKGILLALVNHQECLDKIYEEILKVIGTQRLPAYSDRRNMPYTEASIMEAQRLLTQLPTPLTHRCMEDVEFEGYTIPKDTLLQMNPWVINHDKELWGDPEVMRPDRFLDDSGDLIPPEHKLRQSFFPFGVGKRVCVGEHFAKSRMFLFIATLVQKFKLLPPETGSLPPADPRVFNHGVILETPEYKIRAIPRYTDII